MPAGVRIACHTDTEFLAGCVEPVDECGSIDLFCNGEYQDSVGLAGQTDFRFGGLSSGEKLLELWLPQHGEFRLRGLKNIRWRHCQSARRHQSEVGHLRQLHHPLPHSRESRLHLARSGGQEARTGPDLPGLRRQLPPGADDCPNDTRAAGRDFLSMKVGINIYGSDSLSVRTFQSAIIGFVQIVREKHPDTPFVVISPIFSPPRETTPNAVGFTLEEMRQEVAEAVRVLRDLGDVNLHYASGLELFGPDLAHLLPDDLHPDAEGYKIMGQNFVDKVASKFFLKDQMVTVG